ncbi:hypothetical protein [Lysinibacillus sphaericus]|uniref:hypothetical protein n=1 Tax=Lysinibacillus sphaericus TaxID=1421 RepID=UPI000C1A78E5|nr:hypothetical protein [Lysinibacillus sphaericus]PIJ98029.1 hypothetical protein CTN02_09815 [Lysinibacillus sphaericus]
MPQELIKRLEKRINSAYKSSFWSTLQGEGDFINFNESSREHTYALRAASDYLEEILRSPLIARVYTIVVKMKNGSLEVLKVD